MAEEGDAGDDDWIPPKTLQEEKLEFAKQLAIDEMQRWIESVTRKSFEYPDDTRTSLANGILFCETLNVLKPGSIRKINRLPTPLAGLDNISVFLRVCEHGFGVSCNNLFEPNDLEDLSQRAIDESALKEETEKRLLKVAITIFWLAKATDDAGISCPQLDYSAFSVLLNDQIRVRRQDSRDTSDHRLSGSLSSPSGFNSFGEGSPSSSRRHNSSFEGSTPTDLPKPLRFVKSTKSTLAEEAELLIQKVEEQKNVLRKEVEIMDEDVWQSSLSNWREKRRQTQPSYSRVLDLDSEPKEEETSKSKVKSFKEIASQRRGQLVYPEVEDSVNQPDTNQPTGRKKLASRWASVPSAFDDEDPIALIRDVDKEPSAPAPVGAKPEAKEEVASWARAPSPVETSDHSALRMIMERVSAPESNGGERAESPKQSALQVHLSTPEGSKINGGGSWPNHSTPKVEDNIVFSQTKSFQAYPSPSGASKGREISIRLTRRPGRGGEKLFGMELVGGLEMRQPIRVERVKIGSSADICEVRRGDELVAVQDQSFEGLRLAEALAMIADQENERGQLTLRVRREKNEEEEFLDELSDEEFMDKKRTIKPPSFSDDSDKEDLEPPLFSPPAMAPPAPPMASLAPEADPIDASSPGSEDSRVTAVKSRNEFFGLRGSSEEEVVVRRTSPRSNDPQPWRESTEFRPLSERLAQVKANVQEANKSPTDAGVSQSNQRKAQVAADEINLNNNVKTVEEDSPMKKRVEIVRESLDSDSDTSSVASSDFSSEEVSAQTSTQRHTEDVVQASRAQINMKKPPTNENSTVQSSLQLTLDIRPKNDVETTRHITTDVYNKTSHDPHLSQATQLQHDHELAGVNAQRRSLDEPSPSPPVKPHVAPEIKVNVSKLSPRGTRSQYSEPPRQVNEMVHTRNSVHPPQGVDSRPGYQGQAMPYQRHGLVPVGGTGGIVMASTGAKYGHQPMSILPGPQPQGVGPQPLVSGHESQSRPAPHMPAQDFRQASRMLGQDEVRRRPVRQSRQPPDHRPGKTPPRSSIQDSQNRDSIASSVASVQSTQPGSSSTLPNRMNQPAYQAPVQQHEPITSRGQAGSLNRTPNQRAGMSSAVNDHWLVEEAERQRRAEASGQTRGHYAFPPALSATPTHSSSRSQGQDRQVPVVSSKKKCSCCGKELGSGDLMVIEAMDLHYHLSCFRCSVCHTPLGSGRSDADVRIHHSRLHCYNCYSSSKKVNRR